MNEKKEAAKLPGNEAHWAIAQGMDAAAHITGLIAGAPLILPVGIVGLGGIFAWQTLVYLVSAPGWAVMQVGIISEVIGTIMKKREKKSTKEDYDRVSTGAAITFIVGLLVGLVGVLLFNNQIIAAVGAAAMLVGLMVGLPADSKAREIEENARRARRRKNKR